MDSGLTSGMLNRQSQRKIVTQSSVVSKETFFFIIHRSFYGLLICETLCSRNLIQLHIEIACAQQLLLCQFLSRFDGSILKVVVHFRNASKQNHSYTVHSCSFMCVL